MWANSNLLPFTYVRFGHKSRNYVRYVVTTCIITVTMIKGQPSPEDFVTVKTQFTNDSLDIYRLLDEDMANEVLGQQGYFARPESHLTSLKSLSLLMFMRFVVFLYPEEDFVFERKLGFIVEEDSFLFEPVHGAGLDRVYAVASIG